MEQKEGCLKWIDRWFASGYPKEKRRRVMEIERKFLTKEVPFSLADFPARKISQCYISMSPTIRLRQWDDRYILKRPAGERGI